MTYRVAADIEYLDGTLAGLVLPAGFAVTYPTHKAALSAATWLERVRQADDFIRAAVTGNRYKVRGGIEVSRLPRNAKERGPLAAGV